MPLPKAIPVIYEDKYLLLVNKPAGIVVEDSHGGKENVTTLLKIQDPGLLRGNYILQNAHRLDKPVSGVLLFARKRSVLKTLNAQFADGLVRKTYLAITGAVPPKTEDLLQHWLRRDEALRKAIVSGKKTAGASAVKLAYRLIETKEGRSLLEIELMSGKYHQIRAQLAYLGCPVLGDAHYGSPDPYTEGAIALHARKLCFRHPFDSSEMAVEAALPDLPFWRVFNCP